MGAAQSRRKSAEADGMKCSRCACLLPANDWQFFDYTDELGIYIFYMYEKGEKIVVYIRRTKNSRQWWYYEYSCLDCLRQKDWKTFQLMELAVEGRAVVLPELACCIQ